MSTDRLHGAYRLSRVTAGADRWTSEEWLKLWDAYAACAWDITPDRWSEEQIAAALEHGTVPEFEGLEP